MDQYFVDGHLEPQRGFGEDGGPHVVLGSQIGGRIGKEPRFDVQGGPLFTVVGEVSGHGIEAGHVEPDFTELVGAGYDHGTTMTLVSGGAS